MKDLYATEYLHICMSNDIRNATRLLHKEKHGVAGMFGSLDCPKAWRASYVSDNDEKRTLLLALLGVIADYNMWFWHASFGYVGSLNDLKILNLSPFLESSIEDIFQVEKYTVEKIIYKNKVQR